MRFKTIAITEDTTTEELVELLGRSRFMTAEKMKEALAHRNAGGITGDQLGGALSGYEGKPELAQEILAHRNAGDITGDQLGEALLMYGNRPELAQEILAHRNAGDITGDQLGEALSKYRDKPELVKGILAHRNAQDIRGETLNDVLASDYAIVAIDPIYIPKAGDLIIECCNIEKINIKNRKLALIETHSAHIAKKILASPDMPELEGDELGQAMALKSSSKIALMLQQPKAEEITGVQIGTALITADAEVTALLLTHRNAKKIPQDQRGASLMLRSGASVLDAEKAALILTQDIPEKYLIESLRRPFINAKIATLILRHPNAANIPADVLGKALIWAAREGDSTLFDTVALHRNGKHIGREDIQQAIEEVHQHYALNKLEPGMKSQDANEEIASKKMIMHLENHPNYRNKPAVQQGTIQVGNFNVPAPGVRVNRSVEGRGK